MDRSGEEVDARAASRGGRRRRRALLALLTGFLLAGVGGELLFRQLLFGDSGWAQRAGGRFRRAQRFADPTSDEDFWKLQHLFRPSGSRRDLRWHHPRLGWITSSFGKQPFRHEDEPSVGDRRPVLLFGDSFARGAYPPRYGWQGLLARKPSLASRYRLLNFGVRGYGVDQTLLLMKAVLPEWRDRSPVVVFSLLVDDDLDRCALRFRSGPKPWFEVEGGELLLHEPGDGGTTAWLRDHPPRIRSYLWRYVSRDWTWLPAVLRPPSGRDPETIERKRALARAILEEAQATLDAAGLEYFVWLFHGEHTIERAPGDDWRERVVLDVCEERGIPWVSSRRAILEHSEESGAPVEDYFLQSEEDVQMAGHYNHRGNHAAFPALRRGLMRRFDSRSVDPVSAPGGR